MLNVNKSNIRSARQKCWSVNPPSTTKGGTLHPPPQIFSPPQTHDIRNNGLLLLFISGVRPFTNIHLVPDHVQSLKTKQIFFFNRNPPCPPPMSSLHVYSVCQLLVTMTFSSILSFLLLLFHIWNWTINPHHYSAPSFVEVTSILSDNQCESLIWCRYHPICQSVCRLAEIGLVCLRVVMIITPPMFTI